MKSRQGGRISARPAFDSKTRVAGGSKNDFFDKDTCELNPDRLPNRLCFTEISLAALIWARRAAAPFHFSSAGVNHWAFCT
jgi:hypothetical protein